MLGSTWSGSANRLQNWRATRLRPRLWGSRPSSGRSRRTIGCQSRLTKATAGASSARPATRSGARSPISMATRPPIELPTRWARPISSASITSIDRVGEPARRVRAGERLGGAAEARQVERVDAVARARERRRGVEERGLGRAQPVDAARRRGRRPSSASRPGGPGSVHVVDAHAAAGARWAGGTGPRSRSPGRRRRGRRAGAARRRRRPTARLRAGASQVCGVGPDDDVGLAARASPCARARRGSCSAPPTCGPRRPGGRGRWRRSPPGAPR